MQVPNDEWVEVDSGTPDKFIIQNVGDTRIGFIVTNLMTIIDNNDPVDNGTHGILLPGSNPFTLTDIGADGMKLLVRSLGPKNGVLYVSEEVI